MDLLSLQSHPSLRSSTSAYPARKPGIAVPEFVKLHRGPSKSKYLPQRYHMATSNREGSNGIEEGDGVIIVDHGSRRNESNLMLNKFVAMFRERTKFPIVEPAHMELAEPSIRDAFNLCIQQGARRVIVSPFFLSPGRHWNQDIPSLTAEAAKEHPGVSYVITAPLGLHELLVDVVNDRINHCQVILPGKQMSVQFVLELENVGSVCNILMKLSKTSLLEKICCGCQLTYSSCMPSYCRLTVPSIISQNFDIWELVIAFQIQISIGGCLVTPHS